MQLITPQAIKVLKHPTRDKVIRREIALEEGQVYNSRLWDLSLLRLNQLGYFEQLKPDDPHPQDRCPRRGHDV